MFWSGSSSAAWPGPTTPAAFSTTATRLRTARLTVRTTHRPGSGSDNKPEPPRSGSRSEPDQQNQSNQFLSSLRHRDHVQHQPEALLPSDRNRAVRRRSGGRVPGPSQMAQLGYGESDQNQVLIQKPKPSAFTLRRAGPPEPPEPSEPCRVITDSGFHPTTTNYGPEPVQVQSEPT